MKTKDINNILESTISSEIRKAILQESKDYYHVMDNNQPIETFETYEEAKKFVDKQTGKELIIDKKTYGSYDEMIDDLDEMSEDINENIKTKKMKKNIKENMSEFDEDWMSEEMYEDDYSGMSPHDKFTNQNSDYQEMSEMDDMDDMYEEDDMADMESHSKSDGVETLIDKYLIDEPEDELSEEGMCMECGDGYMEEEDDYTYEGMDQYDDEIDEMYDDTVETYDEFNEERGMCMECGSMLNEEGMCMECDSRMNESKKKKIRLKESELVSMIKQMVMETIPGLTVTNKSREGSKKETNKYYADVDSKMKKYLKFEGNDNPEFPHQVNSGEKVARKNTPSQEDEMRRNFAGLENLEYDIEPSDKFKERLKMAIEGHPHMGNATETPKPSIKPSNDAPKGKEAKEKSGNQIKTDTSKKIEKQVKNRKKDMENRKLYKKEVLPVDTNKKQDKSLSESKMSKNVIEEIQMMKKLSSYNKKTQ